MSDMREIWKITMSAVNSGFRVLRGVRWRLVICFIFLFAGTQVIAATNNVSSLAALQTAINNAAAGDTIILSNGSYTATSAINILCAGTSNAPILIKAQSIGGATISGNYSFQFSPPAAYVTVQGFNLTHAGDQLYIKYGTSHCRLSRNIIQCTVPSGADQAYVKINGNDAQIDYNELRNKNSIGQMLDIAGDGASQVARRLWVHHNYFHDSVYQNGSNGVETVRWGLSTLSLSTGEGLMEYNLFDRCDGEAEMISNKSSGNTYRYNTFKNTVHAQFTIRHGNDCFVYGNYFTNTTGLRIFGDRHQIFNNYFINNSAAIQIGNGDAEVETGGALGSHDKPDDCVIAFNTLIGNTLQYWMDHSYTLGAFNTTFANNLIVGSAQAVYLSGQTNYLNGTWTSNIIWNSTSGNTLPGDMPSGYTKTNPLVTVKDTYGVLHIASNSPAIGAAGAGYTNVTVDMDGQPRPGTGKDIGADQFSSATIIAHFLTTNNVGPFAADAVVAPNVSLTGSAGTNGTVSPASTNVPAGGSANFVITASNYYRIATLTTNGTAVTGLTFNNNSTAANFTWSNVQTSGVLAATFTNQVASDPAATPYSWLAGYVLTNYDTDAVTDQDGDGLTAWQEYIAGTNPTNATSRLEAAQNTRDIVTWSPVSGRVYSVYWSTNLLQGFQPLETNIPYLQSSYTNATPDAVLNYYQIKVRLQ